MTVEVSNFLVPTRCKVSKTENICSRKNILVSRKKKIQSFSTDLTAESVHFLNSSFGAFQTFSNTKISLILNFRTQCLTGHTQRSTYTIRSKWWPKCITLMFLLINFVAAFVFSAKKAKWSSFIKRRLWFTWSTPPS